MPNEYFNFKKFSIVQHRSAMKVGTDGVLIGSWVDLSSMPSRILDVGAGTGLISIMMAQRTEKSTITGIEIENGAAEEAKENVSKCRWRDRISIVCSSFQQFASLDGNREAYDLIVSNPPYFNGTYKSAEAERTAARHAELLSSDDLLDGVSRVLNRQHGRFAAIFPYETGSVIIAKAASKGLYCNRICSVYPKQERQIKRFMVEFSAHRSTPSEEKLIIAQDNGDYTEEYRRLTRDFYLKF